MISHDGAGPMVLCLASSSKGSPGDLQGIGSVSTSVKTVSKAILIVDPKPCRLSYHPITVISYLSCIRPSDELSERSTLDRISPKETRASCAPTSNGSGWLFGLGIG
ncbi:hypothetical protein ASPCADRAFT_134063 [Aspergillus carbonarius ITEM 5010]|uniref:Uncharacterized protein n=1 Tax=Aspergillus carbonarius (strain ITEM 5010) TaxID=602072 RepID=A0A1R3RAJ8_ASPC5|nr:hypothetical protein ASPCADRAFT_134063 [Aspergillus carbonarius ITEM 5010]